MKHLIYLFLVLIATPLVPLTGCTSRAETDAQATMLRARALIDTLPDSSLHLLQSIPPGSLSSERSRALHALLLSQACDKNYIDISSDTLIRPALTYFTSHPDAENLPLAHYYAGRVYTNAADYSRALIHFKHAEALTDTANHILRGKVYQNIADIFHIIYAPMQWCQYSDLAVKEYEQAGNNTFTHYAIVDYSAALISNNDTVKSKLLLDSVKNSLSLAAYPFCQASWLRAYAQLMMLKKNYKEASNYYILALTADKSALSDADINNMFSCLAASGETVRADSISEVYDFNSPSARSYTSAYKAGNYKQAFDILFTKYCNLDSIVVSNQRSQILDTLLEFDNNLAEAKLAKEKQRSQNAVYALLVLLAVILAVVGVVFYNRHIHRIRETGLLIQADLLRKDLVASHGENSNIRAAINDVLQERFKSICSLINEHYVTPNNSKQADIIQTQLKKELDMIRDDKTINKLAERIDLIENRVIASLREDISGISDADYKMVVYSYFGASPIILSILLDCSIDYVYLRRSRLKKKILALPPNKQANYLPLLKKKSINV